VQQSQYAPGHSEWELKRLTRQAEAFEPLTRHFLQLAGIKPGMRVLDVGSGSGDVAFLACELVGPTGEVIGADRAASAISWASARAHSYGIRNVKFVEGDVGAMQFDQGLDAVVGRLVLMYCPDPVKTVRKLAQHLHVGGIMAFQEFDTSNCRSFPPTPTYDRAATWIKKALAASGARLDMGLELFEVFLAAGMPEPRMHMDALIGGGKDSPGYELLAEVVQTLLPQIEKQGIATAAEVEISTLAQRIREEVLAINGVVLSPAFIGAWSRKEAGMNA
jgi:SAM-dependent methyltransferase